jgi:cell division protein FtsB
MEIVSWIDLLLFFGYPAIVWRFMSAKTKWRVEQLEKDLHLTRTAVDVLAQQVEALKNLSWLINSATQTLANAGRDELALVAPDALMPLIASASRWH